MKKPILAMVSDDIRRDLHAALKYFTKVKVVHFYRLARYLDMSKSEYQNSRKYKNAVDLYQQLVSLKPDIIQGPEPYASRSAFFNSLAILKYQQKYQTPFFFPMFENVKAENKFGSCLGRFMKWYLGKYANKAKAVIALNCGAEKNLHEAGIKSAKIKRLLWGTWGIDEEEFYPKKSLKSKEPLILFVGKIEPQKGVYSLIRAFRLLKKKIPHLKLQFVGFGSLVGKISQEPQVEYVGVVKNKDIPPYFQRAWLTASPSIATKIWEEQVGMVNIQAIASGTPVVSTHSGAIPEYIPNNKAGILVGENDYQELAKAMAKLITNHKLREKLAQSGLEFAKKHYRIRDNIKKAQDFVLELLENHVGKIH